MLRVAFSLPSCERALGTPLSENFGSPTQSAIGWCASDSLGTKWCLAGDRAATIWVSALLARSALTSERCGLDTSASEACGRCRSLRRPHAVERLVDGVPRLRAC